MAGALQRQGQAGWGKIVRLLRWLLLPARPLSARPRSFDQIERGVAFAQNEMPPGVTRARMEPSLSSRPLTSLRNIRGKVVCLLACKGHAGHFWMRLQQEVRQLLGIESRSLPNCCEWWGVRTCLS